MWGGYVFLDYIMVVRKGDPVFSPVDVQVIFMKLWFIENDIISFERENVEINGIAVVLYLEFDMRNRLVNIESCFIGEFYLVWCIFRLERELGRVGKLFSN